MELPKKQKEELDKISGYFLNLEKVTSQSGIEIDELVDEFKNGSSFFNYRVRGTPLGNAKQRKKIFEEATGGKGREEESVTNKKRNK